MKRESYWELRKLYRKYLGAKECGADKISIGVILNDLKKYNGTDEEIGCPYINEFSGEYRWLSNFGDGEVEVFGRTYKNREAAFQSMKCKNISETDKFTEMSPSEAKRAGRKVELNENWEDMKLDVMYWVVKSFFMQHPDMCDKLIATEDKYLEEGNTWGDTYWGTCNGVGENHLGFILMKVRDELCWD